jgi:ATP-dependent helicase/DNAse subunit B
MPLTIIKGPPNSGRTEQLRSEYERALAKRPVLVVPSTDDIFDWERRLDRDRGAFLGARVMHFKDLVSEILDLGPADRERTASALRRRNLTGYALQESWPGLAERIGRQPGLIDSVLDLIDEFRAARISPEGLKANLPPDAAFLPELADVYGSYVERLHHSGLTDLPELAMKAVSAPLDAWQGRPLFVAGFDDLSIQQLDLLARLGDVTEVTVALTHELGNPAMAVTESLLQQLEARGAEVRMSTERTDPGEHDRLLFDIERSFMRPDRRNSIEPGEGIALMTSSGLRGEAEAVAAEVASLVEEGVEPGRIAIAVTSPAVNGGRFRSALTRFGIDATLECETPALATSTGQAVINLLKAASPTGGSGDVIAWLRGPVAIEPEVVDWLEWRVRREGIESAREAVKLLTGRGQQLPPGWSRLTGKGEVDAARAIEEAVAGISDVIINSEGGVDRDSTVAMEVQTGTAILRACDELEEISATSVNPNEVIEALASGAVKTWAVPTIGSVRIASPYSLRAKRFEYLFMVSLQEKGSGDSGRSGPFLTEDSRKAIGLPEHTDSELQELYLFYSCLSVPTRRLYLSSRNADESGAAEFSSPLIAAVEVLFDEQQKTLTRVGRNASEIFFDPVEAPSPAELARALAAIDGAEPAAMDLPDGTAVEIAGRIESARASEQRSRTIDSLSQKTVIEALRAKDRFSPTALEAFNECPYRWFIDRALSPSRFGPKPEAMARGSLIHDALAEIYGQHPGRVPRVDDLNDWIASVEPAVERHAASEEIGLATASPEHRMLRIGAVEAISDYLRREAGRESPGFLPLELETGFGLGDEGKPALDMGEWKLNGRIDRIDVSGDAGTGVGMRGVVFDYKTGTTSVQSLADIEKTGRLQLQLYMLALRKLWKAEPTAALYLPVCRGDGRARGIVDPHYAEDVSDLNIYPKDRCDDLEETIARAVDTANRAVEGIRSGSIHHEPDECIHHFEHPAVPDPRLART